MKELINESIKLFNKPEKWNAFLELSKIGEEIKSRWFEKFQTEMIKYFKIDNAVPRWSFASDRVLSYCWFLDEFSKHSVALWLESFQSFQFSLVVNQEYHDLNIVNEILKKENFKQWILTFGPRAERNPNPNHPYPIFEKINWELGSPFDGIFDESHLAWYAGNETEKLVVQIATKIHEFQNEEFTTLWYELNKQSLRKKL